MSNTSPKQVPAFKVGQQIVYPLQGVGKIMDIHERTFKDKPTLYYTIYLEISDMTSMIPVDRASELGIRAIVPREEAEAALELIGENYEAAPADWKLRYQINHDLLKQGSTADIATVVRTLYHRSKVKELPIMERKLYDSAIKLLVDEVSLSLGAEKKEIEAMVFSRLEKDLPVDAKKSLEEDFLGFEEDEGLMDESDNSNMTESDDDEEEGED